MVRFSLHDDAQPQLVAALNRGLDEFNAAVAPTRQVQPLSCAAHSPAGQLVGGVAGQISGQVAELQLLWVAPASRGSQIGAELVRCFEQRAQERGAISVSLSTLSFQARGFYERQGYEVKLEIPGHGPGVSKYVMLKALPP